MTMEDQHRNEVFHKHAGPGSLFLGFLPTIVIFGCGYLLSVVFISLTHPFFASLTPMIASAYSVPLVGTIWYALGRFVISLRYWTPTSRRIYFKAAVLHYSCAFLAVGCALVPAGLVQGLLEMNGVFSEVLELPILLVGLVCGHFAWRWADPRADRIMRKMFPNAAWPDAT